MVAVQVSCMWYSRQILLAILNKFQVVGCHCDYFLRIITCSLLVVLIVYPAKGNIDKVESGFPELGFQVNWIKSYTPYKATGASNVTADPFLLSQRIMQEFLGDGRRNVLFSPFGTTVMLGLISEGSSRALSGAIDDMIGVSRDEIEQWDDILDEAKSNAVSASGLWTDTQIERNAEILERLNKQYDAALNVLDFSRASAVTKINRWFDEKTQGAIPQVYNNLSPQTGAILANALYFKGMWLHPFDEMQTTQKNFSDWEGSVIGKVPMMQIVEEFAYAKRPWGQVVDIPFSDTDFSIAFALPDAGTRLSDVAASVVVELHRTPNEAQRVVRHGHFQVPLLDVKAEYDLRGSLTRFGLPRLFAGSDALVNLLTPTPELSSIVQSNRFSMNEEGVIAASATSTIGLRSSKTPYFDIRLDRPFFFSISHQDIKSPLMVGYIAKP